MLLLGSRIIAGLRAAIRAARKDREPYIGCRSNDYIDQEV